MLFESVSCSWLKVKRRKLTRAHIQWIRYIDRMATQPISANTNMTYTDSLKRNAETHSSKIYNRPKNGWHAKMVDEIKVTWVLNGGWLYYFCLVGAWLEFISNFIAQMISHTKWNTRKLKFNNVYHSLCPPIQNRIKNMFMFVIAFTSAIGPCVYNLNRFE